MTSLAATALVLDSGRLSLRRVDDKRRPSGVAASWHKAISVGGHSFGDQYLQPDELHLPGLIMEGHTVEGGLEKTPLL